MPYPSPLVEGISFSPGPHSREEAQRRQLLCTEHALRNLNIPVEYFNTSYEARAAKRGSRLWEAITKSTVALSGLIGIATAAAIYRTYPTLLALNTTSQAVPDIDDPSSALHDVSITPSPFEPIGRPTLPCTQLPIELPSSRARTQPATDDLLPPEAVQFYHSLASCPPDVDSTWNADNGGQGAAEFPSENAAGTCLDDVVEHDISCGDVGNTAFGGGCAVNIADVGPPVDVDHDHVGPTAGRRVPVESGDGMDNVVNGTCGTDVGCAVDMGSSNNLDVSGEVNTSHDEDISDDLGISDDADISDDQGISDDVDIADDLGISDDVDIADDLGISDDVDIADDPGISDDMRGSSDRNVGITQQACGLDEQIDDVVDTQIGGEGHHTRSELAPKEPPVDMPPMLVDDTWDGAAGHQSRRGNVGDTRAVSANNAQLKEGADQVLDGAQRVLPVDGSDATNNVTCLKKQPLLPEHAVASDDEVMQQSSGSPQHAKLVMQQHTTNAAPAMQGAALQHTVAEPSDMSDSTIHRVDVASDVSDSTIHRVDVAGPGEVNEHLREAGMVAVEPSATPSGEMMDDSSSILDSIKPGSTDHVATIADVAGVRRSDMYNTGKEAGADWGLESALRGGIAMFAESRNNWGGENSGTGGQDKCDPSGRGQLNDARVGSRFGMREGGVGSANCEACLVGTGMAEHMAGTGGEIDHGLVLIGSADSACNLQPNQSNVNSEVGLTPLHPVYCPSAVQGSQVLGQGGTIEAVAIEREPSKECSDLAQDVSEAWPVQGELSKECFQAVYVFNEADTGKCKLSTESSECASAADVTSADPTDSAKEQAAVHSDALVDSKEWEPGEHSSDTEHRRCSVDQSTTKLTTAEISPSLQSAALAVSNVRFSILTAGPIRTFCQSLDSSSCAGVSVVLCMLAAALDEATLTLHNVASALAACLQSPESSARGSGKYSELLELAESPFFAHFTKLVNRLYVFCTGQLQCVLGMHPELAHVLPHPSSPGNTATVFVGITSAWAIIVWIAQVAIGLAMRAARGVAAVQRLVPSQRSAHVSGQGSLDPNFSAAAVTQVKDVPEGVVSKHASSLVDVGLSGQPSDSVQDTHVGCSGAATGNIVVVDDTTCGEVSLVNAASPDSDRVDVVPDDVGNSKLQSTADDVEPVALECQAAGVQGEGEAVYTITDVTVADGAPDEVATDDAPPADVAKSGVRQGDEDPVHVDLADVAPIDVAKASHANLLNPTASAGVEHSSYVRHADATPADVDLAEVALHEAAFADVAPDGMDHADVAVADSTFPTADRTPTTPAEVIVVASELSDTQPKSPSSVGIVKTPRERSPQTYFHLGGCPLDLGIISAECPSLSPTQEHPDLLTRVLAEEHVDSLQLSPLEQTSIPAPSQLEAPPDDGREHVVLGSDSTPQSSPREGEQEDQGGASGQLRELPSSGQLPATRADGESENRELAFPRPAAQSAADARSTEQHLRDDVRGEDIVTDRHMDGADFEPPRLPVVARAQRTPGDESDVPGSSIRQWLQPSQSAASRGLHAGGESSDAAGDSLDGQEPQPPRLAGVTPENQGLGGASVFARWQAVDKGQAAARTVESFDVAGSTLSQWLQPSCSAASKGANAAVECSTVGGPSPYTQRQLPTFLAASQGTCSTPKHADGAFDALTDLGLASPAQARQQPARFIPGQLNIPEDASRPYLEFSSAAGAMGKYGNAAADISDNQQVPLAQADFPRPGMNQVFQRLASQDVKAAEATTFPLAPNFAGGVPPDTNPTDSSGAAADSPAGLRQLLRHGSNIPTKPAKRPTCTLARPRDEGSGIPRRSSAPRPSAQRNGAIPRGQRHKSVDFRGEGFPPAGASAMCLPQERGLPSAGASRLVPRHARHGSADFRGGTFPQDVGGAARQSRGLPAEQVSTGGAQPLVLAELPLWKEDGDRVRRTDWRPPRHQRNMSMLLHGGIPLGSNISADGEVMGEGGTDGNGEGLGSAARLSRLVLRTAPENVAMGGGEDEDEGSPFRHATQVGTNDHWVSHIGELDDIEDKIQAADIGGGERTAQHERSAKGSGAGEAAAPLPGILPKTATPQLPAPTATTPTADRMAPRGPRGCNEPRAPDPPRTTSPQPLPMVRTPVTVPRLDPQFQGCERDARVQTDPRGPYSRARNQPTFTRVNTEPHATLYDPLDKVLSWIPSPRDCGISPGPVNQSARDSTTPRVKPGQLAKDSLKGRSKHRRELLTSHHPISQTQQRSNGLGNPLWGAPAKTSQMTNGLLSPEQLARSSFPNTVLPTFRPRARQARGVQGQGSRAGQFGLVRGLGLHGDSGGGVNAGGRRYGGFGGSPGVLGARGSGQVDAGVGEEGLFGSQGDQIGAQSGREVGYEEQVVVDGEQGGALVGLGPVCVVESWRQEQTGSYYNSYSYDPPSSSHRTVEIAGDFDGAVFAFDAAAELQERPHNNGVNGEEVEHNALLHSELGPSCVQHADLQGDKLQRNEQHVVQSARQEGSPLGQRTRDCDEEMKAACGSGVDHVFGNPLYLPTPVDRDQNKKRVAGEQLPSPGTQLPGDRTMGTTEGSAAVSQAGQNVCEARLQGCPSKVDSGALAQNGDSMSLPAQPTDCLSQPSWVRDSAHVPSHEGDVMRMPGVNQVGKHVLRSPLRRQWGQQEYDDVDHVGEQHRSRLPNNVFQPTVEQARLHSQGQQVGAPYTVAADRQPSKLNRLSGTQQPQLWGRLDCSQDSNHVLSNSIQPSSGYDGVGLDGHQGYQHLGERLCPQLSSAQDKTVEGSLSGDQTSVQNSVQVDTAQLGSSSCQPAQRNFTSCPLSSGVEHRIQPRHVLSFDKYDCRAFPTRTVSEQGHQEAVQNLRRDGLGGGGFTVERKKPRRPSGIVLMSAPGAGGVVEELRKSLLYED